MPTNVATPIWQCDVCGHRFGQHADAAQRCEAAPVNDPLPDGTPLLVLRDGQFHLTALTDTGHLQTRASEWDSDSGHEHVYERADLAHVTPRPTIRQGALLPHKAGYLQALTPQQGNQHAPQTTSRVCLDEVLRHLHVGAPTSRLSRGMPKGSPGSRRSWVNPITDEVRAIFDALGVRLQPRPYPHIHQADSLRMCYLLPTRADGASQRAAALLHTVDLDALDAQIADLQARWFAGEAVQSPWPNLDAASGMTPSKMSKTVRALVESIGVPWPARTSAAQYARTVMKEKLMVTVSSSPARFAGPKVVAVGGVKGGVGKSTTAAALAAALAAQGKQVVLYDADVQAPSQQHLWDLGPVPVADDHSLLLATPTPVPGLAVFSPGQVPAETMPSTWSEQATLSWIDLTSAYLDLAGVDVLVVDLPAGQSTVSEVFLSSIDARADALVAVVTGDPLSQADAARALAHRKHAPYARLVVENLSTVTGVGDDGRQVSIRLRGADGDVQRFAAENKATYAGSLPWQPDVLALAGSEQMRALATTLTQAW